MKPIIIICALLGSLALLSACGGSGSSTSDSGTSGTTTTTTTAASVFPVDLVIAQPYAQASASISASKEIADFETEQEELSGMIEGTTASACAFSLTLFAPALPPPSCYGPTLDYENHPNGADQVPAQLPSGDVGIWNESEGSEVCMAAKINQLVGTIGALVDSSVSLFASVACSLNVNETELPAVGETLDLSSEFSAILSENSITTISVSSVSLARASDDADGHAVYDFAFTGSMSDGENTREAQLYLRHIPLDDTNATYKGKLSFVFSWTDEQGGSQADAGSVLYHKRSSTELVYRLQKANYVANPGLTADPLALANRDIDPTLIQEDDSATGWANDFNYALFSLNPSDGTGSYAYAWSAGSNDPHTRAFNATITAASDGTRSGCAYFGYGPQANLNIDLGSIDGMICNWAGPGNAHQVNELVQRQCVEENASGAFVQSSDAAQTAQIVYAPTNNCDYPGGAFWYSSDAGTMTNDVPAATGAFANELLPIAEMVFTLPTAPTDVY